MTQASEVISAVRAAFAATALPSRDLLRNPHCEECLTTTDAYEGRPWAEIGLAHLQKGSEVALLSPTAWRYYLPAFIILSVEHPEEVGLVLENLIYELEPDGSGWFDERAPGFTTQQMAAIVALLEWYCEREQAEYQALEMEQPAHVHNALRYWGEALVGQR